MTDQPRAVSQEPRDDEPGGTQEQGAAGTLSLVSYGSTLRSYRINPDYYLKAPYRNEAWDAC